MTGPSITGSENGMPISIASAPFAAAARMASCQPGIATGDVRHEQLATVVPLRPELGLQPSERHAGAVVWVVLIR